MRRCWIGVDVGTGGVRALVADDHGAVLAAASRPLAARRGTGPDGSVRHEQDPDHWLRAVREALGEVAGGLDAATVAGIAVDATSGTIVLTAPDGTPLTPGVMYDDARGAAHAPRAQEVGRACWDRLGHRIGASWALPTAMALHQDHPRAALRHQSDVINAWLVGGPVATDTSTALKTGADVAGGRWPTEVLGELGIDPATLPPLVGPGTPLGGLGATAAAATGLRPGTAVLAGMTDGCAAQVGAGAVAPGSWNSVLGTTLILKGVTRARVVDPAGAVYSHRAPQGGWWLPGGASSTGAGTLAALLAPRRFEALTAELAGGAVAEAAIPAVYPLSGRGERFPFASGDAEGFWLDPGSGRARPLAELPAAVGEAAAFAGVCDGIAAVELLAYRRLGALGADLDGPRTISGGATVNRWWNRRRADLLGVELHRPEHAEPAFGMAVLARAGADAAGTGVDGGPDVVGAARAMVRTTEVVTPRTHPALRERAEALADALRARGWMRG